MATTTTNFGWDIPQSTDLVKDGATAIAALGQDIDTALVDLKGGTTGQVLAKASNTDLDYTWTSPNPGDITGVTAGTGITGGGTSGDVTITNSMATAIDAKGDLIAGTSADAFSRLAVGTNGQVLTADSTAATGLAWATPSASGVANLLLNSNFALNQRNYVSAANLASGSYGFDRWKSNYTNTTLTFTASTQGQSITINSSGGLQQVIEQGLVPSGTYTLSWTGTATGRVYNSGGTPGSYAASPVTFTADGSADVVVEFTASGGTKTLSKVQFNSGTGTTWSLATPTLQTELAACQRYYQRVTANAINTFAWLTAVGSGDSSTTALIPFGNQVTYRVTPTTVDYGGSLGLLYLPSSSTVTAITLDLASTPKSAVLKVTATGASAGVASFVRASADATAFIGVGAEL